MSDLDTLIAKSVTAMADLTKRLEDGHITIGAWQTEMEKLLTRYHTAAMLLGDADRSFGGKVKQLLSKVAGAKIFSPEQRLIVKRAVEEQLKYLRSFASDIKATPEWSSRFNARAAMYGESPKATYWRGRTLGMDLPGWPAVGTQCLTRCGCAWEFDGNYARWRRSTDDGCDTCLERERNWSKVRVA